MKKLLVVAIREAIKHPVHIERPKEKVMGKKMNPNRLGSVPKFKIASYLLSKVNWAESAPEKEILEEVQSQFPDFVITQSNLDHCYEMAGIVRVTKKPVKNDVEENISFLARIVRKWMLGDREFSREENDRLEELAK